MIRLTDIDEMNHIALFDTSIGSNNVGDEIIMDYCRQQLIGLFNDNSHRGG